ncbi:MAG: hypothetical protein RL086_1075, partial [Bacteroidota bacterium]
MSRLPIDLKNTDLFKQEAFINGQWTKGTEKKTFPVYNPFNKMIIAEVSDLQVSDFDHAAQAANIAFPTWAKLTSYERSSILTKWHNLIIENERDLAAILT